MTGKTFRLWVCVTIGLVLLLSFVALGAAPYYPCHRAELQKVPGVLVPVGGGWLAYCFQRRVAFTKALFDVWQKLVVTIQDAIQYTHMSKPKQEDFAKVMHDLSCRLDDMRGAFRNVGERYRGLSDDTKNFVLQMRSASSLADCEMLLKLYQPREDVGLYPFETLKQISVVVQRLGFEPTFNAPNAKIARNSILALWKILRSELLKELDRDYPEHSDTPFRTG